MAFCKSNKVKLKVEPTLLLGVFLTSGTLINSKIRTFRETSTVNTLNQSLQKIHCLHRPHESVLIDLESFIYLFLFNISCFMWCSFGSNTFLFKLLQSSRLYFPVFEFLCSLQGFLQQSCFLRSTPSNLPSSVYTSHRKHLPWNICHHVDVTNEWFRPTRPRFRPLSSSDTKSNAKHHVRIHPCFFYSTNSSSAWSAKTLPGFMRLLHACENKVHRLKVGGGGCLTAVC